MNAHGIKIVGLLKRSGPVTPGNHVVTCDERGRNLQMVDEASYQDTPERMKLATLSEKQINVKDAAAIGHAANVLLAVVLTAKLQRTQRKVKG